ncbi:ecto-ADP-ribosyltransferase 4 isoform X2 [Grammomys surdaster]|uniref:ecto-ADP-ribosyltransferase 4 isoform X2 n=1 Tax=Grammomys surdaster TaxID=491861 RepID=UPI00109EE899|nr:ecto-ADP-ribosyltransferase 4 isoform X2 [Grammomys surdaster]
MRLPSTTDRRITLWLPGGQLTLLLLLWVQQTPAGSAEDKLLPERPQSCTASNWEDKPDRLWNLLLGPLATRLRGCS